MPGCCVMEDSTATCPVSSIEPMQAEQHISMLDDRMASVPMHDNVRQMLQAVIRL